MFQKLILVQLFVYKNDLLNLDSLDAKDDDGSNGNDSEGYQTNGNDHNSESAIEYSSGPEKEEEPAPARRQGLVKKTKKATRADIEELKKQQAEIFSEDSDDHMPPSKRKAKSQRHVLLPFSHLQ